jgi:hypothetical protein
MARQPIPQWMKEEVLARDGYACRYCGSMDGPFHMDHVYPVSKGGETSVNNLVTACPRCNVKKHNKVGVWPWPVFVEIPAEKEHVVVEKTRREKSSGTFGNLLILTSIAASIFGFNIYLVYGYSWLTIFIIIWTIVVFVSGLLYKVTC